MSAADARRGASAGGADLERVGMTGGAFDFVHTTEPHARLRHLPLAVGGDLSVKLMLEGYDVGVVPIAMNWNEESTAKRSLFEAAVARGHVRTLPADGDVLALTWWFPQPRFALDVTRIRRMKDARKSARQGGWHLSLDLAFPEVVAGCARGRTWNWMTANYQESLGELNKMGRAHSVEVWEGERLVGGTFGVMSGSMWVGESVFSDASNAGKIAIAGLARWLREQGGTHIDWQFQNPLGEFVGAEPIDLDVYWQSIQAEPVALPEPVVVDHDWVMAALNYAWAVPKGR